MYILNNSGSWDDQGTGEFQIVKDPNTQARQTGPQHYLNTEYCLMLVSEDED